MKALVILLFGFNLATGVVNAAFAISFFMDGSLLVLVSLVGVVAATIAVTGCARWLEREW